MLTNAQRKSLVAVAVAVALAGLACLVGAAWWVTNNADGLLATGREDLSRAEVESVGRFRVPASATGLRAHLDGFQDRIVHVRFEMDRSEMAALVASLKCEGGLQPVVNAHGGAGGPGRPWWQPQSLAHPDACEGDGVHYHQRVVVGGSADGGPRVTVYLVTFER